MAGREKYSGSGLKKGYKREGGFYSNLSFKKKINPFFMFFFKFLIKGLTVKAS